MAGPAQRGTRGRGRSPRHASSALDAKAPVAAGSAVTVTAQPTTALARRTPADPLITRSTYRLLLHKGLAPDEAANLTAYLCGIPVADVHWSIHQVNQLLFLRELARSGRFGPADGEAPRPH